MIPALLLLLSPHGALASSLRCAPPSLQLFPKADIPASPRAPDGRNAAIAALLKGLIDASDDVGAKQSLLDDATPLLLEPFVGIPEPGSVLEGCASDDEKAAKYRASLDARAAKARASSGGANFILPHLSGFMSKVVMG